MKKNYFLLGAILISAISFAQNKLDGRVTNGISNHVLEIKKISNNNKGGIGDTAFFFDGRSFFITNAQDNNDFVLNNIDNDNLTPAQTGYPSDWIYSFYSLNPLDSMPGDNDTAWYIGASSWFTPAGQADNWWTFGPITIGNNGSFSWYNKSNSAYTDGYKVYISTSVSNMTNGYYPYVDVTPGVSTPVYTKAELAPPTPQPGTDTIWTKASVSLASYANQRIWIAFHHDANDKDMCYLDHMRVTSDIVAGVTEKDVATSINVYPNPSKGITNINISLAKLSNVEMNVLDITGKKVWSQNAGSMTAGTYNVKVDVSNFESGVYFYQLITETGTTTKKLYVVK